MRQKIENQSGAVLVTALVLLVILTLLGLSTMTTSILEERMAANSQEVNRSFHAAAAGLIAAFQSPLVVNTSTPVPVQLTVATATAGGYVANAEYQVSWRTTTTPPGRSSDTSKIYSADFSRYHFELESTGDSSGVETALTAGMSQVGPKQQ